MSTKIKWYDETWNPIDEPFKPIVHLNKINLPYKRKQPKKIFVGSMGDLFHDKFMESEHGLYQDREYAFLFDIINTIRQCPKHTFIILTKLPQNMKKFFDYYYINSENQIKNLWLGVITENQKTFDERVPILLDIPAAVRFVSIEPMLEEIDISKYTLMARCVCCDWISHNKNDRKIKCPKCDSFTNVFSCDLDWVIAGGETGQKIRPIEQKWICHLMNQCVFAEVPFFFNKGNVLNGKTWEQFPFNS